MRNDDREWGREEEESERGIKLGKDGRMKKEIRKQGGGKEEDKTK